MADDPTPTRLDALVLAAVEALRDLAGALIDHVPAEVQPKIADVQVQLLQAQEAYHAE